MYFTHNVYMGVNNIKLCTLKKINVTKIMVISNQSCCLTGDQPISGLKVCIVDNHNCKTTNQHKPSGNKLITNHILRG